MSRFCGRFCNGDELQWHVALQKHNSGEFSFAVSQANSQFEDQGQVFTTPYATFIGVYDGHGGPHASRFLNSRMFANLHRFVTEEGGVSIEVIKKGFRASEEEFLQMVECSWQSCPQFVSVGSCCLVGLIAEDMLYVGNLGDSRAVLGRNRIPGGNEVVAERLTSDHNVNDEEIRKEVIKQHPDDARIIVHTRGAWRIKGIIQALASNTMLNHQFRSASLVGMRDEYSMFNALLSLTNVLDCHCHCHCCIKVHWGLLPEKP